jgi:selenocysteine lyase/cysteine desulfurase
MNIDVIAGTGHKALLGPQGTGFLYMREGTEPPPLVDGGTGEVEDVLEIPDRLEAGTINTPGLGGLGAGVEFIVKQGLPKIRAYEEELLKQLIDGLGKIKGVSCLGTLDATERVGLVSFVIEGQNPEEVGVRLDREFSIMVRCGTHCAPDAHMAAGTHPQGAVRVSPGYFNKPGEIEEFLAAIEVIAKG